MDIATGIMPAEYVYISMDMHYTSCCKCQKIDKAVHKKLLAERCVQNIPYHLNEVLLIHLFCSDDLRMTRTDVFFFWCRGKYKSISNNFHLPQVLCRSPLQLLKGLKWNLGTDLVHVIQRIRPNDLGDHQSHTSCATMRLTSVDIFFLTMTTIFP